MFQHVPGTPAQGNAPNPGEGAELPQRDQNIPDRRVCHLHGRAGGLKHPANNDDNNKNDKKMQLSDADLHFVVSGLS